MTVVQWFLLAAAISILVGAGCGLFSFYLTCREAADQIGVGAHPRCGMGESGDHAAGADTSRPYDQEAEDAA